MRRLIASEGMSLDGKFADPDGGIGWQSVGPAHRAYSVEMLDEVDALLFGRTTYDGMRSFWPTEQGRAYSREIAERMNAHVKLVASHRELDGAWTGARRLDGDLVAAVRAAKAQPGKGIAVLGSGSVLAELSAAGVVDELRITLDPVVLGAGRDLFAGGAAPRELRLVRSRPLDDGAVLLVYRPRGAG